MEASKETTKDAGTIVRNVFPGLVFVIEFLMLSWFGCPELISELWGALSKKELSGSLFAAVAVFLGSGGLGYLFAIVHHWMLNWSVGPTFNYYPVIRYLTTTRLPSSDAMILRIAGRRGEIDLQSPNMVRDWTIVTMLWHQRRETNQQIGAATARAESLVEKAHGVGAVFVASAFAFFFAAFFTILRAYEAGRFRLGDFELDWVFIARIVIGLLVGIFILRFHWVTRNYLVNLACNFVGSIILDQIRYDAQKAGEAGETVTIYFAEIEIDIPPPADANGQSAG